MGDPGQTRIGVFHSVLSVETRQPEVDARAHPDAGTGVDHTVDRHRVGDRQDGVRSDERAQCGTAGVRNRQIEA